MTNPLTKLAGTYDGYPIERSLKNGDLAYEWTAQSLQQAIADSKLTLSSYREKLAELQTERDETKPYADDPEACEALKNIDQEIQLTVRIIELHRVRLDAWQQVDLTETPIFTLI